MSISALPFILLVPANLATYCLFWMDKRSAQAGNWRVPERTLLIFAAAGGSVGALLACRLLRHKTRKQPFRTVLLTIVITHIGLLAVFVAGPKARTLLDAWAAVF